MIEIKKIIYWHFYVYPKLEAGAEDIVDPSDLGEAISTLKVDSADADSYIKNFSPEVRSYSLTGGKEWLVKIFVADNGSTQDLNAEGQRSGIRTNNTQAAPGFVWFDLSVSQLNQIYGSPVLVSTLEQMSLVNDGSNNGARKNIKYALFAVHKSGQSGTLRGKPDAYFDYLTIPNEVVDNGNSSFNQLKTSMSPKVFVDESGSPSGFFVNIKTTEKITKLGCCDIISSSSSSSTTGGGSSSSSSASTNSQFCSTDINDTIRAYHSFDNKKRVWAVRQTADIHASNNPVRSTPLSSDAILKRRSIHSELVWADVTAQVDGGGNWSDIRWNHAGYIGFRNQLPKYAVMHVMPSFNKSDYSAYGSAATLADSYDYNFEMPIAIQSIAFDDRGYLWALCSGGFKDSTPITGTSVSNVETTEGIYRIIPGGWKKKPLDVSIYGGALCSSVPEPEELNRPIISNVNPETMAIGFTSDGNGHYFAAIDKNSHVRLWKQSEGIVSAFPDDSDFVDDNGNVVEAKFIACGFDKIAVVSNDGRLYAWTCNSSNDSTIISKIDDSRSAAAIYKSVAICKNCIVGLNVSGSLVQFAKDSSNPAVDIGFTQADLDTILTDISIDGAGPVSKIVGGRLFVAVLTLDGRIYAKGKMGNNITIEYNDFFNGGTLFLTLRGNITFRIPGYKNIAVHGEFLAGSYLPSGAVSTEFRFGSAAGIDSCYDQSSALLNQYADEAASYLDLYVFNQIRQMYSKYSGNKRDIDSAYFYNLLDSNGLLGVGPAMNDGSTSPFESSKFDVFEPSEMLHPPIKFATPIPFGNSMIRNPSLFGWQVSYSKNGQFMAVSAPGEGGTVEQEMNSSNGLGKVYIYIKKQNGYKFFQTLSNWTNTYRNFGKCISFSTGLNSNGEEVVRFFASISGVNNDIVNVYESSIVNGLPTPFVKITTDALPITLDEGPIDNTSNFRVASIYSHGHITCILKTSPSASKSMVSIINNNLTPSDYTFALGGAFYFSNLSLSLESSVSISLVNNVYNIFIGDPGSLSGQNISSITVAGSLSTVGYITMGSTVSTVSAGCVYQFAFRIDPNNGIDIVEQSTNVPYNARYEYSNAAVESKFGKSISSDEKQLVVGCPWAGANKEGEINVFVLSPHDSLTDVVIISNPSSPYIYKFADIINNYSTSVSYPADLSNRNFGTHVKLINNKIIVSAADSDAIISSSQASLLPGEIYILESNELGQWIIVGSHSLGHVGDRFGRHFDVISSSISGLDIAVGASGYVGGSGVIKISKPLPNSHTEGVVKLVSISGGSLYGCLPSVKINKILDPNLQDVEDYKYDRVVLGKRHFAGCLSNVANNKYIWDYDFAQLTERSIVDIETNVDVPNFKLAKFPIDPVSGVTQLLATYSDLGAFSMEDGASNSPAPDLRIASMPLYISEDKTLRIMEMHPRPFREVDASAEDISDSKIQQAKESLPPHVDELLPAVSDTYMTPVNAGVYKIYAAVESPPSGSTAWTVNGIELSKSFAISPVRANRWSVPVKDMLPLVYDLYSNKIAIASFGSGYDYIHRGGFTVLNDASENFASNPLSIYAGNPVKQVKDITLSGSNPETWWSSGNYISPGCIQVVDSGFHGPTVISKAYSVNGAFPTQTIQELSFYRWFLKLDTTTSIEASASPSVSTFQSNYFLRHRIQNRDIASYRIAVGGMSINWDAGVLSAAGANTSASIAVTSKFLGWSGCTIGSPSNTVPTDDSSLEKDHYDFVDLNNGAISISGPPINIKVPSFGSVTQSMFVNDSQQTRTLYLGADFPGNGNDVTGSIYGWNASIYFKGKKDAVIHGTKDLHRFFEPGQTIDPVADRRSQVITYVSGFGAYCQRIYNNPSSAIFPQVLLPNIRFGCILDKRLSKISVVRKNLSANVVASQSRGGPVPILEANTDLWTLAPYDYGGNAGSSVQRNQEDYNRMIAPTDTMFITDLFFQHNPETARTTLRGYLDTKIKTDFSFSNSEAGIDFVHDPNYLRGSISFITQRYNPNDMMGSYIFGPTSSLNAICNAYSFPNGLSTNSDNSNFFPLITSFNVSSTTNSGTASNATLNDLFSGWVTTSSGSPSYRAPAVVFHPTTTPPNVPSIFTTLPISSGNYKYVLRYPYKTSILTGRGRCVQISPLGSEKRSITREEIVYQNEFIYRRLRYFVPRTFGSQLNTNHNCGYIRFNRPILIQGNATLTARDWSSTEIPEQMVNSDLTFNSTFVTPFKKDYNYIRVSGGVLNQSTTAPPNSLSFTTVGTMSPDTQATKYEIYPEVRDAEYPNDLINKYSLVCLPTFSVPYMFQIGSGATDESSFVFAALLLSNAESIDSQTGRYPQLAGPETTQLTPGYNILALNRNYVNSLSAFKKLGLNNQNNSPNTSWFASAAAFIQACAVNKAHIFDINTSVVNIDGTLDSMASITILASVNAYGSLNGESSSLSRKSREWSNGVINGGGLLCVNINCRLNANGAPYANSFNSTMDVSIDAGGAVLRDFNGTNTNTVSSNNTVQRNVMRSGLWLQPLLGLRSRVGEVSSPNLDPNLNFFGNTPHYWPGNHVKVNSEDLDSGWLPPCYTSTNPKYVPTGAGMVKVPLNRSWIVKAGKHKMLFGKTASASGGTKTWYSVIGPFVYCINQSDFPTGSTASTAVPSPTSYLTSDRMSCFKMPAYEWDSRPIVFQRFGMTDAESSDPTVNIFDFKALRDNQISSTDNLRYVKSFFNQNEISTEISNSGASPSNAADIYYFMKEGLDYVALPKENDVDNSFAMLGEGLPIRFQALNGSIIPIIFWRDSFYVLSKDPSLTRPTITRYSISNIDDDISNDLTKSYSLLRQNAFFNEKDQVVISGNNGNLASGAISSFIYLVKISYVNEQFTFTITNSSRSVNASDLIKPMSGIAFSDIDRLCNQSWRYSLWMSQDSSIICIGKHRWTPELPDNDYIGSDFVSPTPDGNPKSFFVDVLSLQSNGEYKKIATPNIIGSNSMPASVRPIDSMCESIWGVSQGNGLWKIHCMSGQEPEYDYLAAHTSTNTTNPHPRMKNNVHVFEAQVQNNSSIDPLIELNNLIVQSDPNFSNSSYNNMNFWTMTPISAKNGSCGITFLGNTLVASTGGHIVGMNASGDNYWRIKKITGQSSLGIINKTIQVSRVASPYSVYGLNASNSIVYASGTSDIKIMKTICVPSCISGSAFGYHNYANKLCPVVFNIAGTDSTYLATISNTFANTSDQVGVFDVNTQLKDESNPGYKNLVGGKTDGSNQRYNPSLRSWLQLFSVSDATLGASEDVPFTNYDINSINIAHVLVKPPVPSGSVQEVYFAGSEALPMDVSMTYRDYNTSQASELGTMMQMDWHDIAGIMSWSNNSVYVMRSFDYGKASIDIAGPESVTEEESWMYLKSYYKNQNGISYLPMHGFIGYSMPADGSSIQSPVNLSSGNSRYGIGMTGPKVISVSATANKFIPYNGANVSIDSGTVKENYTFALPLLKNRNIFGNVRVGVILQDNSSMSDPSGFDPINISKASLFGRSSLIDRFNANDVFVTNCMALAQKQSLPLKNSYLDIKQSGFSCPSIIHIDGPDCGYPVYVRKVKYTTKNNSKWNLIIDNLARSIDPDYGFIFNSDKLWISRLSYIYGNIDTTHNYASWHFVPNGPSAATNQELSPFACVCGESLRSASKDLAKWKTNRIFSTGAQNIVSCITGNVSITSKLQDKSANTSDNLNKLTDLVLIGDITQDFIQQARNIIGVTDNQGLLNGIEISMYNSGANSVMVNGGSIHIVDTSNEFTDEKSKFIADFCAKFKGFYTRLNG